MKSNINEVKGRKMKNFVMTVFMFLAIMGIAACSSEKSIDKMLTQIAAESNRSLPMMVDGQTRLNKIEALPGKKIQYENTVVDSLAEEINIEFFKESVGRTLLATVKNNPALFHLQLYPHIYI